MTLRRLHRYPDREALAVGVARRVLAHVAQVQTRQALAQVCIPGGDLAHDVVHAITDGTPGSGVDPARLGLWWDHDHWLPTGHPSRHATETLQSLAALYHLSAANTHAWPAQAHHTEAVDAARAYAEDLAQVCFDLCVVIASPEGGVAGIAPGSTADTTHRQSLTVVCEDADGGATLSLTMPALNRSRALWVLASGADHADVVSRVWEHNESLPVQRVHGERETRWFVDAAAASGLEYHRCTW